MSFKNIFLLFCISLLTIGCTSKEVGTASGVEVEPTLAASDPLLVLRTPEETGITFSNQIIETFEDNILHNIYMYNGGGVCIGDFDKDGQQDIYFISSFGANSLYLNRGNLKFEDVTEKAGVVAVEGFQTAAVTVDINADGWQDIYVCRGGKPEGDIRRNLLFVNNGKDANGQITFTESAKQYGLDVISRSTGAAFFDYDKDGDLDCYLLNYPTTDKRSLQIDSKQQADGSYRPNEKPESPFDSDQLFRNDGKKGDVVSFVNVSKSAGIWNYAFGLSVSITDFNRDGWPDIYVGNDFIHPDFMYINNKNGTFSNVITTALKHTAQNTMGTDLTDFDNDGLVDIFSVDMYPPSNYRKKILKTTTSQSMKTALLESGYFEHVVHNVLQKNNGDGSFQDVAYSTGLAETDWSWSCLFFDMDNDGLRDIHITNGYRREISRFDIADFIIPDIIQNYHKGKGLSEQFNTIDEFLDQIGTFKARNFCYQNKGNLKFESKGGDWLTISGSWSGGSAWADFDKDGDLDLVINNLEDPAFFYENKASEKNNNNYLQVAFEGPPSNQFGIGASVGVYEGQKLQIYENYTSRGIFSTVEPLAHFGLGENSPNVRVVVRWPDGKAQVLNDVAPNQRLVVKYTNADEQIDYLPLPKVVASVLEEEDSKKMGLAFKHQENPYNDFEAWPLHMWGITDFGPYLSKADVNSDGTEDLFVSGGPNQASKVFLQQKNGTFKSVSEAVFEKDAKFEDYGALFCDIDFDGDLDLFVCSGGAEYTNKDAWTIRMYLNKDGKGTFEAVPSGGIFPAIESIPSRMVAGDFDQDGDNDIILAGRSLEGAKWPMTPKTYVLRNDRNKFTDISSEVAPELASFGMITDLIFADLDKDQIPELLVAGEMMPISVFKIESGKFKNITESYGLQESHGLWNRILPIDLDVDGDLDIVAGNFGLNSRFSASPEAPMQCFAGDFDDNKTIDAIMTQVDDGKSYPMLVKSVLTKQMPFLRKKYNYSNDYALATIEDIIPKGKFADCKKLKINYLESGVWINNAGTMQFQAFPIQAQMAPIYGIIATSFNGDAIPDLLLAGNKHELEVETGPMDAGVGSMLIGDGKGGFLWADNRVSGFWAKGEVRDMLAVRDAQSGLLMFMVANNNGPIQVFKPKQKMQ